MMQHNPAYTMDRTQVQVRVNTFVRSVYNWMAIGLALTGGVAYFVANTPALFQIVMRLFFLFAIAEIGLVFFLSARIGKMQAGTATTMFIVYAVLNGATLSFIFIAYAKATIATAFFTSAGAFAALSIYGWVTKRDLTGLGNFLFMGLIGIVIASVVNIFLRNPAMQMMISYIAVLVFAGLTAYDTQTIKNMALSQPANLDGAVVRKGAIIGALKLYLDFILLFQYLLYILGGRRD
jgi:FtsH-binding integral membrane protein